jgi:hypothetical protein
MVGSESRQLVNGTNGLTGHTHDAPRDLATQPCFNLSPGAVQRLSEIIIGLRSPLSRQSLQSCSCRGYKGDVDHRWTRHEPAETNSTASRDTPGVPAHAYNPQTRVSHFTSLVHLYLLSRSSIVILVESLGGQSATARKCPTSPKPLDQVLGPLGRSCTSAPLSLIRGHCPERPTSSS